MLRRFKELIYMLILICFASAFAFLLSLFDADKFISYAFFFFISAFLCKPKAMPFLLLFFIFEYFITKTNYIYSVQLFCIVLFTSIFRLRLSVCKSLFLSYVASTLLFIAPAIIMHNSGIIFDKSVSYIIALIFSLPFIFALIRSGFIQKPLKGDNKNAKKKLQKN